MRLSNLAVVDPFLTCMRSTARMFSRHVTCGSGILLLLLSLFCVRSAWSQDRFYNYYDEGLEFMEKGDWLRAIEALKSAISLEYEDTKRKRTYGTKFIQYFPHRELGIAYYNLGEAESARKELALSLAYKKSKKAKQYLEKLGSGSAGSKPIVVEKKPPKVDKKAEEDKKKQLAKIQAENKKLKEREKALEKEKALLAKKEAKKAADLKKQLEEVEKKKKKLEEERIKLEKKKQLESKKESGNKARVPVGALTYDPGMVTQVGSRLSMAVLPFEIKGSASDIGMTVSETIITQLVNLRRFKVLERSAMDKVLQEQDFIMSDMVTDETAVELGKLAGADAIIVGSVSSLDEYVKVSARVIDIETAETIVAKEEQASSNNIESIEASVGKVAIAIYNDLPLVEGYVVQVEADQVFLDLGSEKGIRKGTKCVVFKEGKEIKHPVTGEILGKKVTKLGEVVVVQVQEKLSIAKFVEGKSHDKISAGDRVVVK